MSEEEALDISTQLTMLRRELKDMLEDKEYKEQCLDTLLADIDEIEIEIASLEEEMEEGE